MTHRRALITDLDDTLWDWLSIWHASFSVLLEAIVAKVRVPREEVLDQIRAVNVRHRTSEVSTLLQELPAVQELAGDVRQLFAEDLHKVRSARKEATRLYPGVKDTLAEFRRAGWLIVGYTESISYWSCKRLKDTGIDVLFHALYTSKDHELPPGMSIEDLRTLPPEEYELPVTVRTTPIGEKKPNPQLLLSILDDLGVKPENAVYVGDNLWKDVRMAQTAGVPDVWARYGEARNRPAYELLRRVSHWTNEDIEREKQARPEDVRPSRAISSYVDLRAYL